jgi:hypothetical protein
MLLAVESMFCEAVPDVSTLKVPVETVSAAAPRINHAGNRDRVGVLDAARGAYRDERDIEPVLGYRIRVKGHVFVKRHVPAQGRRLIGLRDRLLARARVEISAAQ